MPCPYGIVTINFRFIYDYYSVHMIRHNDKFIQFNMWEMTRDLVPTFINDSSTLTQTHRPIDNLSKHTITVECIDSHKISTRLGIIVVSQPD